MTISAAEADRRIANALTVGTVISIDNGNGRARVRVGELELPPIPVMQIRSGDIKMHWMPSPGEQVTIAAPSGDMARAFVMGALPIDGNMVAPDAGSPTMDLAAAPCASSAISTSMAMSRSRATWSHPGSRSSTTPMAASSRAAPIPRSQIDG